MAQYNEEEMKMRAGMFDLAIPVAMMLNAFAVSEWVILQEKYGFSETEYPALKRAIDSMRDTSSFAQLRENHLLKLAMISNPMENTKTKEDNS